MIRYVIECILHDVPRRRLLFCSTEEPARKIADIAGDDIGVSSVLLKKQTRIDDQWETLHEEVIKEPDPNSR